jgi:hypothetical protein
MVLQTLHNPDVVLALGIIVVVLALTLTLVVSRRSNARMEFFLGLMKDFPKDRPDQCEPRDDSAPEESEEDLAVPVPRNIDF